MMGMMLKAHREKEEASRGGKGGGGGHGARVHHGGGRAREAEDTPALGGSGGGGGSSLHGGYSNGSGRTQTLTLQAQAAGQQQQGRMSKNPTLEAVRGGRSAMSGAGAGQGHNNQGQGEALGDPEHPTPPVRGAPAPAPALAPAVAPGLLNGLNLDSVGVEQAYDTVGHLERKQKALLAELRAELGAGGAQSIPSPSSGGSISGGPNPRLSAALSGHLSRARGALSRTLGSIILRDPALSLQKRLPNRLWMAHYRELEIIQQQLRRSGGGGGAATGPPAGGPGAGAGGGGGYQALRTRLLFLIQEAEREIGYTVEAVEAQIAHPPEVQSRGDSPGSGDASGSRPRGGGFSSGGSNGAGGSGRTRGEGEGGSGEGGEAGSETQSEEEDELTEEERGRQQVVQVLLTSLGDLARYQEQHHLAAGGSSRAGATVVGGLGWGRAEELYLRALRVNPMGGGKAWNQLAVLATCRKDSLGAYYAYLRGICTRPPNSGGRENLVMLHERCKARLSSLREVTALDALGMEEHQARFQLYLLGASGTCLSRVDLGTFDGYLALAERHMVSCMQLHLMKAGSSTSTGVGAGSALVLAGGGGRGRGGGCDERGLEGVLTRAMILCVCTVSASIDVCSCSVTVGLP
ncbi:unnamed protein product [Discosporangium mesarthrocarpum]